MIIGIITSESFKHVFLSLEGICLSDILTSFHIYMQCKLFLPAQLL